MNKLSGTQVRQGLRNGTFIVEENFDSGEEFSEFMHSTRNQCNKFTTQLVTEESWAGLYVRCLAKSAKRNVSCNDTTDHTSCDESLSPLVASEQWMWNCQDFSK